MVTCSWISEIRWKIFKWLPFFFLCLVGNLLEEVVDVTLLLFVLLGFELTLLSPLDWLFHRWKRPVVKSFLDLFRWGMVLKLALSAFKVQPMWTQKVPKSRTNVKGIKKRWKEKRYLWKSKRKSRYFFFKVYCDGVRVVLFGNSGSTRSKCRFLSICDVFFCTYVAMDYNISTCNLGRGRKKKKKKDI